MNGDRAFLYVIPCVAAGLALGYFIRWREIIEGVGGILWWSFGQ